MDPYDNPYVSCPYNPKHRVLRSRIHGHIVKCEKKYPPLEWCPFNATHRMTRQKLMEHMKDCPSRPEQKLPEDKLEVLQKLSAHRYPEVEIMSKDPNVECWD